MPFAPPFTIPPEQASALFLALGAVFGALAGLMFVSAWRKARSLVVSIGCDGP